MIRRGEVYKTLVETESQKQALVLVVSYNANNRSKLPTVHVLAVVPQQQDEATELEVTFELEGARFSVTPLTLTGIPKKDLSEGPVKPLEASLMRQVDALIARYLALSPTAPKAS